MRKRTIMFCVGDVTVSFIKSGVNMFFLLIKKIVELFYKILSEVSLKLWKTLQVYHNFNYRKIKNAKIDVLWKTDNNKLFTGLPQNFNNSMSY